MTGPAIRPGRLRRFAFALLALAAAPAAAQTVKTPQAYATAPADHLLVTPNGVDLRSGRFDYRRTDLSIGGEGEAGLQLTRIPRGGVWGHAEPFANFTHNLDIMIAEKRVHIAGGNYHHGSGSDYRMIVRFDTRSETFDGFASGPHFEQVSKTAGARLTYSGSAASGSVVYAYQAADGTVATFRPLGNGDCSSQLRCAYVSQIDLPDGTRLSFDYENPAPGVANMTRLRAVVSSRGYALLLEYGGGGGNWNRVSKACVINLATRPKPVDNACPADAAAASAYSYGSLGLTSSTDAGGAVSTYQHGQVGGGLYTIGFVKPGQSSPWLTNTYGLFSDEDGEREMVVRQALAGGQTWDIGLQTAAIETENQIQQHAGGDIVDAEGRRIAVRYGFPRMPKALLPGNPEAPDNFPGEGPRDVGTPPVYQITAGPVTVTDALQRTTRYDYCDPVIAASLPAGEEHRCVAGPLRAYTDPEGIRTELTYDAFNNVTQIRRRAAARAGQAPLADVVVTATYACWTEQGVHSPKSCAKPETVTDAKGNVSTYRYAPEHGGMLVETGPPVPPASNHGGPVTPQTRHQYRPHQPRLANGDPAGPAIWLLTRSSSCRIGNPHPSGSGCALGAADEIVTTYDYGPDNGPTNALLRGRAVTADGQTLRTCYGYDSRGRKISETSPMGTTGLAACPADPPTAALPYTSGTRYDSDGRVTGTIAPDPDGPGGLGAPAVRNSYDEAGRLTRVEQGALAAWQPVGVAPAAWPGFTLFLTTDTQYDALDRKTREAVSGGGVTARVTEYSYDLAGRPRCTAARMNPGAWAAPLADPCVPGPAHPVHGEDRISRSVHDDAGQPIEAWDGVGTALQRREAAWTYDRNGRKTSLTDARGFRAEMEYDGLGRQSRWIFPSKASAGTVDPGDYEEYGYDPNGNRTSLRKRDGSVLTFHHDALNRMSAKIVPERAGLDPIHSRDVFYLHDNRGLRTRARFDHVDGEGLTTVYDGFGRVISSTTRMGGFERTLAHLYDAGGNRTRLAFADGVVFGFAYDGLDRMTLVHDKAAATSLDDYVVRYWYRDTGLRHAAVRGAGTIGFTSVYYYDSALRLSILANDLPFPGADLAIELAYNPAGQIRWRGLNNDAFAWRGSAAVVRDYAVNGQNQYGGTVSDGVPSAAFGYDANGNLASEATPSTGRTYVYDVENRLVSASGESSAQLVYDPLGRLFQVGSGSATTRFLHDGDELVAEYDGSGTLARRYVHGPGTDEPVAVYYGSAVGLANRRYMLPDERGSIAALVNADGSPAVVNSYDEYGIPGAGNDGRFQYTGQAWIPELGLYHYKARFYSPTLGRFLQVDPVGYDGGIILYAYVDNDPVNRTDPSGLCDPTASRICAEKLRLLDNARAEGIRKAWAQERKLVAAGGGTRPWTRAERSELLREGKVKGYEGHHINTVKGNPIHFARDPNNVRFETHPDHVQIHRKAGGYRNPITGKPLISRLFGVVDGISVLTGALSGRLRSDSFENFAADLLGYESWEDTIKREREACKKMGFDDYKGVPCV